MKRNILFLLCILPGLVVAQDAAPVPNPPDIPPPMQSGESLEPDVTIIERKDDTVYEYRVNGRLYKIRVQPTAGPAYYYVDLDGDGDMEFHSDDPYTSRVPQWVLFRW